MAETGKATVSGNSKAKVRGNSKPNVKRRGSTYTYYLYVVGPDGKRRQHSKGGFKTSARLRTRASPPSTRWRRATT